MTTQTNIPNPNGDGSMLTTDDLRRLGWDQATLPGRNDHGEWLDWTYKAVHHRDGCKGQQSELRTSSNVGDVDDDAILARFEYLCGTCQRMLGASGTGGTGTPRAAYRVRVLLRVPPEPPRLPDRGGPLRGAPRVVIAKSRFEVVEPFLEGDLSQSSLAASAQPVGRAVRYLTLTASS
jgi:hypothetical protein